MNAISRYVYFQELHLSPRNYIYLPENTFIHQKTHFIYVYSQKIKSKNYVE